MVIHLLMGKSYALVKVGPTSMVVMVELENNMIGWQVAEKVELRFCFQIFVRILGEEVFLFQHFLEMDMVIWAVMGKVSL